MSRKILTGEVFGGELKRGMPLKNKKKEVEQLGRKKTTQSILFAWMGHIKKKKKKVLLAKRKSIHGVSGLPEK